MCIHKQLSERQTNNPASTKYNLLCTYDTMHLVGVYSLHEDLGLLFSSLSMGGGGGLESFEGPLN